MRDWTASLDRMARRLRDTFPSAVAYTLKGESSSRAITGIFDLAHTSVSTDGDVEVSTVSPMLTVRDADLPRAPKAGDSCVIDGRSYQVIDTEPDGSGMTPCILHGGR